MAKLKSIADLMSEISNVKNARANELPTENVALINSLDERGKLAAVELIVNKDSKVTAKNVFLSTFEGITVESIMNATNKRARGK